ncbi:class I SAM-dependent methyltransferase [Candidatus Pacearchaeota archaeon]|nr:class I SAM-dependent methyltransferase [Candidatus Pacearchaeota archaeon]
MGTEKIAEKWWKNANQNKENYYKKLYKSLKFSFESPVLEIGGGNGSFLKYMGIKKATIIDIAGKESLVGEYKFVKANITKKLPKINKKYKTIFVMEVLEHIKNPLYLMAQVYDLLDEEGNCYISIPYTKLDIRRENQENHFNCHVCRWTLKEIVDDMRKLGFLVRVLQKRRRFKNTAFFLPHCWIVLHLKKRVHH